MLLVDVGCCGCSRCSYVASLVVLTRAELLASVGCCDGVCCSSWCPLVVVRMCGALPDVCLGALIICVSLLLYVGCCVLCVLLFRMSVICYAHAHRSACLLMAVLSMCVALLGYCWFH